MAVNPRRAAAPRIPKAGKRQGKRHRAEQQQRTHRPDLRGWPLPLLTISGRAASAQVETGENVTGRAGTIKPARRLCPRLCRGRRRGCRRACRARHGRADRRPKPPIPSLLVRRICGLLPLHRTRLIRGSHRGHVRIAGPCSDYPPYPCSGCPSEACCRRWPLIFRPVKLVGEIVGRAPVPHCGRGRPVHRPCSPRNPAPCVAHASCSCARLPASWHAPSWHATSGPGVPAGFCCCASVPCAHAGMASARIAARATPLIPSSSRWLRPAIDNTRDPVSMG